METQILVFLFYILMLSAVLGFELISKVPPTLHTPLMSGSNAISGISIVGAILASNVPGYTALSKWMGLTAIVLATINVIGGYAVTERMLKMFKKK
jgi:H+-translocating NAD(P) transhydrogenase subunit alpha